MSRLRELQERLRRRKCASHNVDMVVTGTRRGKVVGSCDRHGAPPPSVWENQPLRHEEPQQSHDKDQDRRSHSGFSLKRPRLIGWPMTRADA